MSEPTDEHEPRSADARAIRHRRRVAVQDRARERMRAGRDAEWRRNLRRARRALGERLLGGLAPRAADALSRTWRFDEQGREQLESVRGSGFLAGLWHGRMLPLAALHRRSDFVVLVSASRDGDLAERLLAHFRFRTIRGSTSRHGARSLREMRDLAAAGQSVVITPDGPRGPRHSINVGLAWLARATGMPILTVGVAVDRAWRLRSWDRFVIPKPFARIAVEYGEPVRVPRDCGELELEATSERLRDTMLELERRGFARLGVPPDF